MSSEQLGELSTEIGTLRNAMIEANKITHVGGVSNKVSPNTIQHFRDELELLIGRNEYLKNFEKSKNETIPDMITITQDMLNTIK